MPRLYALLAGFCACAPWGVAWAGDGPADARAAQAEFFEKNVRPVLSENCFGCHGPAKHKAGLRVDSLAAILKGGDSGPALQPGNPDESLLIRAVRYDDEERQMPPKGKLDDAEIAALRHWVKSGAIWPDAAEAPRTIATAPEPKITAKDRAFWSFQPIKDEPPPAVADVAWPKSPIDRFVLARLEAGGLKPVAPADKRTLIRRATFDLIGLPPTPQEVEAFLADEAPGAFARVVDRLLASPHYGERWGRHWLDVARYGEDQAHTFAARLYPYGYRYRDWVIKAFNNDLPFDQFIVAQVAGDLLEGPGREQHLAAAGFFALGPAYYGKAVFDELDDRVDTLCRGFLGLTVACARCHDHKFDPIPTEDYYALAGIFASTEYKEYPQAPAEVVERYERAQAAIKAKTAEVTAFLQAQAAHLADAATAETARYMVGAWVAHNKRKVDAAAPLAKIARAEKLDAAVLGRWLKYLFGESQETKAPQLARWRKVIESQDASKDLSGDAAARGQVAEAAEAFQAYVKSLQALRAALETHEKAAKATGFASAAKAAPELDPAEASLLRALVAGNGLFAVPRGEVEKRLDDKTRAALKAKRAELAQLTKQAPPKPPVIHSLTEGSSIADMHVHIRGNPGNLGAEVPRRFLSVLSGEKPARFRLGSGRLELARAIASKDNPLTARVMVNRIWAQHFGRGLVATPSNFGALGERPTHPELLDFLASRFIASGWSIKTMHRMIMVSATYQLSSALEQHNEEIDPANTLLWRMNRRRLEVEPWRDAMLAVSGRLERRLGGPSVELTAASNHRRTVYAAISRHNLDSLLRLFDFPDPNITSDKRTVTSVPLQQLFVLNSEFVVEQAKALAARLTERPGESDGDRVSRAFLLLFGRPARPEEVQWAVAFLHGQPASNTQNGGDAAKPDAAKPDAAKPDAAKPDAAKADAAKPDAALSPWQQLAQVLLGSNEFLFVD